VATFSDGTRKEYEVAIAGTALKRSDVFMLANSDTDQITLISCEVSDPLGQAREVVIALPKEKLSRERNNAKNNKELASSTIVGREAVKNSDQDDQFSYFQNNSSSASSIIFMIFGLFFIGSLTIAASFLKYISKEKNY